jgi:hypothetical protein
MISSVGCTWLKGGVSSGQATAFWPAEGEEGGWGHAE